MKKLMTLILGTALVAGSGLAWDKDKDKDKDKNPPDKVMQHTDPYGMPGQADSQLIREVRHELIMLPYYGVFDDLGFVVNGNDVTLVGSVVRPTLKDDAGRVVKRIQGVGNVTNNIEVLPLSPNDDHIRMATYRAIYGDPALSTRYGYRAVPSIHIIVKNGHVRLEGVVANEMDRNLAGIRANGVHGAFSVTNDLQVEEKGETSRSR